MKIWSVAIIVAALSMVASVLLFYFLAGSFSETVQEEFSPPSVQEIRALPLGTSYDEVVEELGQGEETEGPCLLYLSSWKLCFQDGNTLSSKEKF